jgi:hypothetical protein
MKIIMVLAFIALGAACFLNFTSPGHWVLSGLGLGAACVDNDC